MNKEKIYRAKPGAMFSNDDAMVYGPYLERLSENKDKLTPREVVEDARDGASPIHNYFDWDNTVAGEKWRTHQARLLLNHITVVIEKPEQEEPIEVRAFFSIKDGDEDEPHRGYVNLDRVLSEEEYRQQIIRQALKEVSSWKERYQIYKELTSIFKEIEKVNIRMQQQQTEEKHEQIRTLEIQLETLKSEVAA